jgi:lariat debranching enzyme
MRVAVLGCIHGRLDDAYSAIYAADWQDRKKTDIVLCCGDFQAIRDASDLSSMAVPPKHLSYGDFYK